MRSVNSLRSAWPGNAGITVRPPPTVRPCGGSVLETRGGVRAIARWIARAAFWKNRVGGMLPAPRRKGRGEGRGIVQRWRDVPGCASVGVARRVYLIVV